MCTCVQCVHVYTAGAGLCQAPSDQGRCTWRQRRSGGHSREGETGNWGMQARGPGGCWAVGGGGGYSMSWQVWRNWWCEPLRPDTASPGNIIEEVQPTTSSKCLRFYAKIIKPIKPTSVLRRKSSRSLDGTKRNSFICLLTFVLGYPEDCMIAELSSSFAAQSALSAPLSLLTSGSGEYLGTICGYLQSQCSPSAGLASW